VAGPNPTVAASAIQRLGSGHADAFHLRFDLGAPLGEQPHHLSWDAGDLEGVPLRRHPRHAQPAGQLGAQGSVEHWSTSALGAVYGVGVQRRPAAVRAPGHVGDQDMSVQLGVAGTAGAMPEPGGDETAAAQPAGPELLRVALVGGPVVRPPAHEARLPLQPSQRLVNRGVQRLDDVAAHQRIRQRVQHRHRLGGREGEIESLTRLRQTRSRSPFGVCPVPGFNPAITARRSSPETTPLSLSAELALPSQRPGISPCPV
jgi:hypothetical protein